jgi:histidyl-tRNA synthetase
MMKLPTAPPRGMRDVLPDEVDLRDRTLATILDVYRRRGFVRIETPAVESLALLTRGEGGENEKLIFKILKRGERLQTARDTEAPADLGLRFDLTVPLARYYANNHARLPNPLKAIQIGPVWRAERPQHGRFRQFTQCDIDILGVRSEIAEIELILATADALLALGLDDLTVRINDRRLLAAVARRCGFEDARFDSVFIALDKLDKIEAAGVVKELAEEGHPGPAVSALMALLEESAAADFTPARLAERLGDAVDATVVPALRRIIETVTEAGGRRFRVAFDPSLVRGMSYYTGPIFEIRHGNAASSIAGGGRYDRMVGKLLGRDVPACGFSIGFERLVAILGERGAAAAPGAAGAGQPRRVALVVDEGAGVAAALSAARALRAAGDLVSVELRRKNVGKQLDDLARHGFDAHATLDADGRPIVKPLTRRERA